MAKTGNAVELQFFQFPVTAITMGVGTAAAPVAFTGTGTPFNVQGIEVPIDAVLLCRVYVGNMLTNAAIGSMNLGIGDITTVATPGTVLGVSTFTNPAAAAAALPMLCEARVQASALVGALQANPIRTFQPVGGSVTLTASFTPTANVGSFVQVLSV